MPIEWWKFSWDILILKFFHYKHFSSIKNVNISQDKKYLLHKAADICEFQNKMAVNSFHFIMYCFTVRAYNHMLDTSLEFDTVLLSQKKLSVAKNQSRGTKNQRQVAKSKGQLTKNQSQLNKAKC